jgi:hypothetical protein
MILLGLSLLALSGYGQDEENDYYNIPWSWSPEELNKIQAIEEKLKQEDGFWIYKKKTYEVKSDISARFTAETVAYMDYFITTFDDIFPMPPAGNMLAKMDVVVYKDRKGYMQGTSAPEWSGGVHWVDFWKAGWPVLHVATFPWNLEEGKQPDFCNNFNRGTLQHEGTHAMFRKYSGRALLPVFVNEGCATFFETFNLREKGTSQEEIELRRNRGFHMENLVRKIQEEPDFAPSLKECVKWDSNQWGSGDIGLHYGLAESFADYMLTDSKNRKVFKKIIDSCYKRRMDKVQVLDEKEIEKLEPGWHVHIQKIAKKLAVKLEEKKKQEPSETMADMTPSEGVTGDGKTVRLMLPLGVTISKEEFAACNNHAELMKLVSEKIQKAMSH